MSKTKTHNPIDNQFLNQTSSAKRQKTEVHSKTKMTISHLSIRAIIVAKYLEKRDVYFRSQDSEISFKKFDTQEFKNLSFTQTAKKIITKISHFSEEDLNPENVAYARQMLQSINPQKLIGDELERSELQDIVSWSDYTAELIANCCTIDQIIQGDQAIENNAIKLLARSIYTNPCDQYPPVYGFNHQLTVYNSDIIQPIILLNDIRLTANLCQIDRNLQGIPEIQGILERYLEEHSQRKQIEAKEKHSCELQDIENHHHNFSHKEEQHYLGTILEGDEEKYCAGESLEGDKDTPLECY